MLQTTTSNDPEHHFFGSNIQAAYGLLSPKQISMALSLSFVKQKSKDEGMDSRNARHALPPLQKEMRHTPFLAAPGFFFPMREDLSSAKGGKQQISRRELI